MHAISKAHKTDAVYVGIDPGLDGAVVEIDGKIVRAWVMPLIAGKKRQYNLRQIWSQLALLPEAYGSQEVYAALEKGQAMPKQGVSSMFRFGFGCGLLQMALVAAGISYVVVRSQEWQKVICKGLSGDPKQRSIQAAGMQLPELELRKSEQAKGPHRGKADAACLALYARWYFGREEARR